MWFFFFFLGAQEPITRASKKLFIPTKIKNGTIIARRTFQHKLQWLNVYIQFC